MASDAIGPPVKDQKAAAFGIARELLAGLTVSFVAISLGAAFGVMSERGALAGILSAGVIALVTAAFGGTRIQCSGPTAPMTAVTLVLIGAIHSGLLKGHPGVSHDHFINLVLVLTGLLLLAAGCFRLGRFISLVPNVVISGFMNGIALLIWVDEFKKLFGLGGKEILVGGMAVNLGIAGGTLACCFVLPWVIGKISKKAGSFLPSTLVAVVVMTLAVNLLASDAARVELGATIKSFADVQNMVSEQCPTDWSFSLVWIATPFAAQLAMLAYLDTLLTSLVVDKKVGEMLGEESETARNRELTAQGVANSVVSLFGGIPGAQATIRSVLILNEGAVTRLAGVMVGAFVIVELLLFQDWIALIPKAVFTGVLIKVGYDVFDWQPLKIYWRALRTDRVPRDRTGRVPRDRSGRVPKVAEETKCPKVTHLNIALILGTTLVTVLINLNVAVVGFCLLFYLLRWRWPIRDLVTETETEGFADEG